MYPVYMLVDEENLYKCVWTHVTVTFQACL